MFLPARLTIFLSALVGLDFFHEFFVIFTHLGKALSHLIMLFFLTLHFSNVVRTLSVDAGLAVILVQIGTMSVPMLTIFSIMRILGIWAPLFALGEKVVTFERFEVITHKLLRLPIFFAGG